MTFVTGGELNKLIDIVQHLLIFLSSSNKALNVLAIIIFYKEVRNRFVSTVSCIYELLLYCTGKCKSYAEINGAYNNPEEIDNVALQTSFVQITEDV